MLNKIASNYLEKIAFWETTKDIARNIPKGVADYALATTEETLVPAGRFGHKVGARIMSPVVGLLGITNGQGWNQARKNYINGVDAWVDKAYKNVNKDIERDRQTINRALPTTTQAGANTRVFSEGTAATLTGLLLGNTTSLANKSMTAANAFKNPVLRRLSKAGIWLTDKFGTDEVAYRLTRAGDQTLSRPQKKRITPAGEYLLGLYGEDNYVPTYW